jgi:hypothetical protein
MVMVLLLPSLGCLEILGTHTLYLEPEGAVTWVVLEAEVRVDGTTREERRREERRLLDRVVEHEHPAALALERMYPAWLSARLLREDRPLAVYTEAFYPAIDDLYRNLFALYGVPATVSLEIEDELARLDIALWYEEEESPDDGEPPSAPDSNPQTEADEEVPQEVEAYVLALLAECRIVLTEGAFVEARGFEIVDDGRVAKPTKLPEREQEDAGPVRLWLAWTLAEGPVRSRSSSTTPTRPIAGRSSDRVCPEADPPRHGDEPGVRSQGVQQGKGLPQDQLRRPQSVGLFEQREGLVQPPQTGEDVGSLEGWHVSAVGQILDLAQDAQRLAALPGDTESPTEESQGVWNVHLRLGDVEQRPAGLIQLPRQLVGHAQPHAGQIEARIHVERLAELRDRLVVPAAEHVGHADHPVDDQGQRVQLAGASSFRDRLGETAHGHQEHRVPLVGRGVVGAQLDRSAKLKLRGRPVPVVAQVGPGA